MSDRTIIYAGMFELPDEDAAAHRVHGIGKMLLELGYKIIYVGFAKDLNLESYNTEDIRYYAEKKPQSRKEWLKLQTNTQLLLSIIEMTEDLEGVILYNFPAFPFGKVRLACKKRRVPLYADCTEWHHDDGFSIISMLKNFETYKRICFDDNNCDGIIVISSYLENFYKKKKTIKIPPVFDYEELRNNNRIPNEKLTFVFTGTISAQKENVVSFVSASEKLKAEGYEFISKIYGVSEDDYKKNMPNSNTDCVEFMGRVSHDICLNAIRKADFQVFYREASRVNTAGFPTKFAESFSCGTPVITSKTSDIPEYLIDGTTGFFVENGDVLSAMRRACEASELEKERMRANVIAEQRFDYRTYIEGLNTFLHG